MCYIEYDWTFNVYRFRFGDTFTDCQGVRSLDTLQDWRDYLPMCGFKLGRKTDSRTWSIDLVNVN